jgi:hypothetical protein
MSDKRDNKDAEAYQDALDHRAGMLADLAAELVTDPEEASGLLGQASMLSALRHFTLKQWADAQLETAENMYASIQARLLDGEPDNYVPPFRR